MSANTISLGEFLRQEREKRGVTIEQVASATKIGVRTLYSLEADHYGDLPAKPFIRGFVSSYARFVGLDPKEVLTRFNDFIDEKASDRPVRDGGHSGYAFEKRDGEQSRTILWFIMGGFIVLGGLVIFVFKPSLKHHRQGHVERLRAVYSPSPEPSGSPEPMVSGSPNPVPATSETPAPAVAPPIEPAKEVPQEKPPEKVIEPTSVPAAEPSVSPSPTASVKPDRLNSGLDLTPDQVKYRVVFKALEDVWVRYQVDSKPVMKFILRKDRILVLRAQEWIRFQTSDPESITMNYSGRGTHTVKADKNTAMQLDAATLIFPPELSDKIKESFPGESPLPGAISHALRPVPSPSPSAP